MAASPDFCRRLTRVAAFSAASLCGVALLGCADAFTYSRTETAHGRTILEEGDHEEAALIFANQVRRSPKDYRAHYHLGEARLAGGRPGEAIRSFKTGLEVMPLTHRGQADDEYRFYLVDALSGALAEYDADGSQLAQIERKSTGDKTAKLLVAMTHAKAGRPDNAVAAFGEASTLDRRDPQIAKQYGLYLASIRQEQAAEQQLRRAYRLNTQDEEVAAALRRLGVVPGPAVMSSTELSKPPVPLGPLPEIKWSEITGREETGDEAPDRQAPADDAQAEAQADAPAPSPRPQRGLN